MLKIRGKEKIIKVNKRKSKGIRIPIIKMMPNFIMMQVFSLDQIMI